MEFIYRETGGGGGGYAIPFVTQPPLGSRAHIPLTIWVPKVVGLEPICVKDAEHESYRSSSTFPSRLLQLSVPCYAKSRNHPCDPCDARTNWTSCDVVVTCKHAVYGFSTMFWWRGHKKCTGPYGACVCTVRTRTCTVRVWEHPVRSFARGPCKCRYAGDGRDCTYGSISLKSQNAKVFTIYNEIYFSIFLCTVNRELDTYRAPRGSHAIYAIWLFCGLAMCYNNFCSTAIIYFHIAQLTGNWIPIGPQKSHCGPRIKY